ncbi:MAG: hypothetical protein Kow0069_39280 [Promethearchaeota archaeon]
MASRPDYYAGVHGVELHRAGRRRAGGGTSHEAAFRLENDPELDAAGVVVVARVEVDRLGLGRPKPTIAFRRRDGEEGVVRCVHLALDASAGGTGVPRASRPLRLSPEEHFVALRSYVAAVAEVGVERLLADAALASVRGGPVEDPDEVGFGFNVEMRHQVVRALSRVAPKAARRLVARHVARLAREAPAWWFVDRLWLVHRTYDLKDLLADDDARAAFDGSAPPIGSDRLVELCRPLFRAEALAGAFRALCLAANVVLAAVVLVLATIPLG